MEVREANILSCVAQKSFSFFFENANNKTVNIPDCMPFICLNLNLTIRKTCF